MVLADLLTPALVLDEGRMQRNIDRMRVRLAGLGVAFRPHLKTAKCIEVATRMMSSPAGPATVSTLAEAEQFFERGVTDILYAVGIVPSKLPRVAGLRSRGCDLSVILDSVEAARAVSAYCRAHAIRIPVLIEIDADDHRGGVKPGDAALIAVGRSLTAGADLRGVMTHAGASYACRSEAAIADMAEQERRAVVEAAARLRSAGLPAPVVSVGSTPTATFARGLDGVTEVRAGVFVFQDLVMAGLGACSVDDIALSVLVSVIGHQRQKGWVLTDGGWMAVSRDRGTARQSVDRGYGLVADIAGRLLDGLTMTDANQEHGIISRPDGGPIDWAAFPLGARLRILPNHACATAAQHAEYAVVPAPAGAAARLQNGAPGFPSGRTDPTPLQRWGRFGGW